MNNNKELESNLQLLVDRKLIQSFRLLFNGNFIVIPNKSVENVNVTLDPEVIAKIAQDFLNDPIDHYEEIRNGR